jgi:long-chain acyl-CoA synthetase
LSTRPITRGNRAHLASLVENFRRYGDQTAVVSRTGLRRNSLTYAQLAELAGRFAALLHARGIHKGDRVLLWGESGGAWLAAFWGCVLRGAVVVPLDVSGSTAFAVHVIREVTPKLVVCDREKLTSVAGTQAIALEDLTSTLPRDPLFTPVEGLAANDILQIVFTSGTTAEPKGVVHTHHNVLASFSPIEREIGKYLKWERPFHPLRFLVTVPLSHVFGQFMGIWIPPLLAAEAHFESRYVARDLIDTIHRERISVLAAVPRVLEILRSDFDLRFPDLGLRSARLADGKPRSPVISALRRWWIFRDVHRALGWKFLAVVSGGATLNDSLESFWKSLGFVVVQGYGMTETTALVSLTHPFHPLRTGSSDDKNGGYVGKVLPGRDVRLGPDGEVLVSGEMISQATWEGGQLHPRESAWLATGDVASLDASGNLRFRGRKKDVIVSASGLNIYPEDLEAALLRQPAIKAAAVVEFAGPKGGEPMAALVLHHSSDPVDAMRRANAELAEYQQIRRWTIWPEPDLPRGPTGKILRRVVAAQLNMPSTSGAPSFSAVPGTLAELIASITGINPQAMSDSARLSEDLHLDSLGRVELQSSLETRFGVELDDVEYQNAKTLGQLKQLLQARPIAPPGVPLSQGSAPPPAVAHLEHAYPTWPWSPMIQAARVLFQEVIMRPLVWLLAAPRVVCDANPGVVSMEGSARTPLLIVANHVTLFDVPLILFALPRPIGRRVAVAMAGELLLDWRKGQNQGNAFLNFVAPLAYWVVTALFNVFPLPQSANFRASFAHAGRAMDRGYNVLVFPEGRRTRDGDIHAFQAGSGILWKDLRVSALPVYLGGVTEIKVQQSRWFRSGKIWIRVGSTLPPLALGDPAEGTRHLEQAVRSLANPFTNPLVNPADPQP